MLRLILAVVLLTACEDKPPSPVESCPTLGELGARIADLKQLMPTCSELGVCMGFDAEVMDDSKYYELIYVKDVQKRYMVGTYADVRAMMRFKCVLRRASGRGLPIAVELSEIPVALNVCRQKVKP